MLHNHDHSQKLSAGLAFLAGFIDALGFLSLGGVFVSFMSGNSTRFAVGLIEGDSYLVALIPFLMIVLFVIGVMVGRVVRHFFRQAPSTAVLVFICAALSCAGISYEFGSILTAAAFMTLSMGAANNIFVHNGEVSIAVTYITGALVKFGQRLATRILGERDHSWKPHILLWLALVTGSACGASGYVFLNLHALWAAVCMSLALALLCGRMEREA